MFQIIPCTKSHMSWKFHENPLTCFSIIVVGQRKKVTAVTFFRCPTVIMLLTGRQADWQTNRDDENNLHCWRRL